MTIQKPLSLKNLILAALGLLFATAAGTAQAQAQYSDLNGGFETGTFTPDTTWAGGQAVTLASPGASSAAEFPSLPFTPWTGGWAPNTVKGVYWVNSSSAYDGSKYLYLAGQDNCFNLLYGTGYGVYNYFQGLTPGQTYQLSFFAASAQDLSGGATAVPQTFRVEYGDGALAPVVTTFSLATNNAWSDSAQSAIPWESHSFYFTPTSATGSLTLSTDANAISAIVLDGVSVQAVPEPGGALLIGAAGALLIVRRRRSVR